MKELYNFDFNSLNDAFDSDLALERKKASTYVEGVDYKRDVCFGGVWERLKITSEAGEKNIGRPIGLYDTLTVTRMDNITPEDIEDAKDEVARELCRICDLCDIIPVRILVVGLGNHELTPDSIGPYAASEVEATMHIKDSDPDLFDSLGCSEIGVLCPNVTSNSGMSASAIIKGVADIVKPSLIIAIDSLASRSSERLGTTIQVSSTGIIPGTGIGHSGVAINQALTGAPVIAIGVPTVINTRKLFSSEAESIKIKDGMFVSPKGINKIVKNAAKIIGGGINQAFGMCYF